MLGRRSFLISCGWVVAGLAGAKAGAPEIAPIAPAPTPVEAIKTPAIALYVQGWETPPESGQGAGNQLLISIDRSWRATWR